MAVANKKRIETKRLVLRPFNPPPPDHQVDDPWAQDLDFFVRVRTNPNLIKWSGKGEVGTRDEAEAWLRRQLSKTWSFIIELKVPDMSTSSPLASDSTAGGADSQPPNLGQSVRIGGIGITLPSDPKSRPSQAETTPELGYFLTNEYHGCGYGPEAVQALINTFWEHVRSGDEQPWEHLRALTDAENVPSIKLLEKCGFHRVGSLERTHYSTLMASWRDESIYQIDNPGAAGSVKPSSYAWSPTRLVLRQVSLVQRRGSYDELQPRVYGKIATLAKLLSNVLHLSARRTATMFRNNYDNDSVTFSPQGRIFQVEYAQEAVKQGSVVVGLVSKTHVVMVALKGTLADHADAQRNAEELSSYQKKLVGVDDHISVAIAGLTSDARVLLNFMKQQALASKMTYGRPLPLERVVGMIGDRAQSNTQHYGRRPYGVGLLVGGVDAAGPHLFEFLPSGLTQELRAGAIGGRSQMARTYLERHLDTFADADRAQLIRHGLLALKESLGQDRELTVDNTSVAVVGIVADGARKGRAEPFHLYDGADVGPLIEASAEGADTAAGGDVVAGESMDVDA